MVVIDNPYFIRSVVANTAGRFGTNISGYPAPHKKHDEPIQYDDRFKWILPPVMDNTLIAQPIQLAYYDTSYPNVRGDGSEDLQIYVKYVISGQILRKSTQLSGNIHGLDGFLGSPSLRSFYTPVITKHDVFPPHAKI